MAAIPKLKPEIIQDSALEATLDAIPFNWNTAYVLANKFKIPYEEAVAVLASGSDEVKSRTVPIDETDHTYYGPEAILFMAKQLGVEQIPKGPERPLTLRELMLYVHNSSYAIKMRAPTIQALMVEAGVEPDMYLTGNDQVVMAYPYDSRDIPLKRFGYQHLGNTDHVKAEVVEAAPHLGAVNWLARILVNPKAAPSPQERKRILAGQSCLLAVLNSQLERDDELVQENLTRELVEKGVEPNDQMRNVMRAKKLNFPELVLVARRAQLLAERIS
jgi:hypothetical protein